MLPQHSNTTTIESINRTFMLIDLIDKHQPLDSESQCNYFIHGGTAPAPGWPASRTTSSRSSLSRPSSSSPTWSTRLSFHSTFSIYVCLSTYYKESKERLINRQPVDIIILRKVIITNVSMKALTVSWRVTISQIKPRDIKIITLILLSTLQCNDCI